MPRTLPWLADAAKKKDKMKAVSSSPRPKRQRDSSPEDLVDSDLNAIHDITPEKKPRTRPNRTPSTSPPPAPPDVEYMREGYSADDVYMMVEDEFLSTAKMFTQHIHHAEYVRLKKLAKSRGAGTLQAITRPTDGRTAQSNSLRLRLEAEENASRVKDGVKEMGVDDSSEAEDAYMQDPQLAGLMTRENQGKKDLSRFLKAKANTRAAAGFSQSPRNVERKKDALADGMEATPVATSSKASKALKEVVFSGDDEDDLDASSSAKQRRPTYAKAEKRQRAMNGEGEKEVQDQIQSSAKGSRIFKAFAEPKHEKRREGSVTSRPVERARVSEDGKSPLSTTNSDEVTSRNTQSAAAFEYLAKRRADKERKEREEKRKTKKADDIPTFLF